MITPRDPGSGTTAGGEQAGQHSSRTMGNPIPRYEARAKVTGQAVYAADNPLAKALHGNFLTSHVARGTIRSIDTAAASAMAGVVRIYTYRNAPKRKPIPHVMEGGKVGDSNMPLVDPEIRHAGEVVAFILAESWETAREAANHIILDVTEKPAAASFESPGATQSRPAFLSYKEKQVGDFETVYAKADYQVDASYTTPTQHHNPIELFSTTAIWHADELLLQEATQFVHGLQHGLAEMLDMDPAKIRVENAYVGGAFGSRSSMMQRTALVAAAARELGRPVKLVLSRQQGFTLTNYRAETRHHVKLGADASGKLLAYSHEGTELSSRADAYIAGGIEHSSEVYAIANVATRLNLVHADRNTPGFMRAPPEMPYMYALECAIDEMATSLNMDPVELRRRNDTMHSPISGVPYTSRSLMQCYDQAAAAFGWQGRSPKPASMRSGDWLIGYGCATATYPTYSWPCAARIRLNASGKAFVEVAIHELGQGAYTMVQQIVAGELGLEPSDVSVALCDSRLPAAPGAGGSMTTASAGSAVHACAKAIIARLGAVPPKGQIATMLEKLQLSQIEEYAEWLPPHGNPAVMRGLYKGILGTDDGSPVEFQQKSIAAAFGAEFVEVRIHRLTREIRVPRMVGAFASGHIVNPTTAHSQHVGGMIWGMASALLEHTEMDTALARYVNDNIAEYLVAVNADVPKVEVILVPETDTQVNPIGVKGLGELANVGTAAAIANAVFHATGRRIRELPITVDKLL